MNKKLNVCVACGFKVFKEYLSGWEICPVCGYQDSIMGLFHPFKKTAIMI